MDFVMQEGKIFSLLRSNGIGETTIICKLRIVMSSAVGDNTLPIEKGLHSLKGTCTIYSRNEDSLHNVAILNASQPTF